MKNLYVLFFTILISAVSYGQTVFINEIHYDNAGTDFSEGVEIAGPAGTNLSTYTISAYNGTGGAVYNTVPLSGIIPDEGASGFGALWFAIPGLQNGIDGIALDNGALIQFLSYEGSFMATDGPAINVTSSDIGVSESSVTEDGESLQLLSSGITYDEFAWAGPIWGTQGNINTDQTFSTSTLPSVILFDGPPNGATFIADPDTPNPQNLDISFVTSNFIMSTDAGGGTGSGGDGFIQWSVVNTNGNVTVDGGNVFTSNTGLPVDIITGLVAGESYIFSIELVDNTGTPLNPTVVYSFTFTIATYTDVANIAALRTQTVDPDLYYRVTGEVVNTFRTDGSNGQILHFQDGSAGIKVFDPVYDLTGYNTGDAVSNIRGHLELVAGELELFPGSSDWGGATTTGNIPAVSTASIATILANVEDYKSELVNINEVTFADGNGTSTFAYLTDYSISDGTSMVFRTIFEYADYVSGPHSIPQVRQNIVAIVSIENSTVFVTARHSSDLTSNPLSSKDFEIDGFNVYPNPTSIGYVNLSSKSNSKMDVTIFDILGKQVVNNKVINNRLDVSNLKAGIYIMKAFQDDATTTKKLVIK